MIFPYRETRRSGEVRFEPIVKIQVLHGNKSLDIVALVDSGAERSLMPRQVADDIGLDLSQASQVEIIGAGGHEFPGFMTVVDLQLGRHRFRAPIIFTEQGINESLLGQNGFFSHFTVTFRYARRDLVITPSRPLNN